MRKPRRPSPAMVLAGAALIVALGGTAVAGGVLNKRKVNAIISKRAPGLSVLHASTADSATAARHASTADSATAAQSATTADTAASVGGVSIQPLSLGLTNPSSVNTLLAVGGSSVEVLSCSTQVDLELSRGPSGPPISGQFIKNGVVPTVVHLTPGSVFGVAGTVLGLTASIREASGRVTRLTVDAFYEADAFGGPEDCFVQGTIERFG